MTKQSAGRFPHCMRLLIIHPENRYFAGAEKMLGYFLGEWAGPDDLVAVAAVRGSRVADLLPSKAVPFWMEDSPAFAPRAVWRKAAALKKFQADFPFDVVHGWGARDWELAALTGWLCRCPAIGTLHDHPEAGYISAKRRRLMRWCAKFGLKKITCVSKAVQAACIAAGYPSDKLTVVHNGLPLQETGRGAAVPAVGSRTVSVREPETGRGTPPEPAGGNACATGPRRITAARDDSEAVEPAPAGNAGPHPAGPFRIGFLGTFSELKGLRDLFHILDAWSSGSTEPWELHLGGGPQDEAGEQLLAQLRESYQRKSWWPLIHWHGWVRSPRDFLGTLDLLVMPSRQFDSFPTVLLEAGLAGVPVLAARAGGASEIVQDGRTGWLFEPGNVEQAIRILDRVVGRNDLRRRTGQRAVERIEKEFSATKMVAEYRRIYSTLLEHE